MMMLVVLFLMRRMLSLPGVDKVLIKQHHYGAASVKPTHLLVINGGRARDILGSRILPWNFRKPLITIKGRDAATGQMDDG